MEVRLKSSLTERVDYLKTIHLSNRFSLKAERNSDKFSVLVFVLNLLSFCLTFFFFLSSSVWPFYFYFPPILPVFLTFRLCAWLSVCTPGPSQPLALTHLLSLTLPLPLSIFSSIYRSGS